MLKTKSHGTSHPLEEIKITNIYLGRFIQREFSNKKSKKGANLMKNVNLIKGVEFWGHFGLYFILNLAFSFVFLLVFQSRTPKAR